MLNTSVNISVIISHVEFCHLCMEANVTNIHVGQMLCPIFPVYTILHVYHISGEIEIKRRKSDIHVCLMYM